MKIDQKGFSLVEGSIILVVVALIGLAGWLVWSRNNSDKSSQPSTSTNKQVKTPQEYRRTATIPSDWKLFTDDNYKISFKYPSKWTISTNLMTKKAGEDIQNAYSINATKIFVICYRELNQSPDMCSDQIDINNQPFDQSLTQLRKYYQANKISYKETEMKIDGHKLVEFRTEAQGSPAERNYLVDANGYTYELTTVYEGEQKGGNLQGLTAANSLALFESIKIQ